MEEEVLSEIVKENEGLFTKEELNYIQDNYNLVKKVYLLGITNSIQINKL